MYNLNEDLFILFNPKTGVIYRAQNWAGGRPTVEMKTWKTLNGATKGLAKLDKPGKENPFIVAKLAVKDINEL